MKDCLLDGIIDTLKLLPYLFITFLLLEFIEHKLSKKNQKVLTDNKKYGPLGTLIAVFLSTSDEMLPIMISEKVDVLVLIKILGFKVLVGILVGFIVDLIYRHELTKKEAISDICEHDHCDCEHDGIIISSIKHTLKIGLFILIANLLINIIIFKVGEDNVSNLLLHGNMLTYFVSSLVGLIPNCAGSVIITELYLANMITVGTMLAGLLTGSGLGILLLFKTNKSLKENLTVLFIIYFVGVIIGTIVDLVI